MPREGQLTLKCDTKVKDLGQKGEDGEDRIAVENSIFIWSQIPHRYK